MTSTELPEAFQDNLTLLLEEAFASPERPGGTAYLDQRAGWYPTLEGVSAEQASRSLVPGGATLAGHVEHARFHLDVVLRCLRGSNERADWTESWRVREVTEDGWEGVKTAFMDTAERAQRAFVAVEAWGDREVGSALAALAHATYHLGVVRQMLLATRR